MSAFERRIARSSVAIAAFVSAVATAQTFEAPGWKVGDKWVFSNTARFREGETTWSREVIAALPDNRFRVKTRGKSILVFDAEGNSLDERGPEFSWKPLSFPMTPGKSWSYYREVRGEGWQGYERGDFTAVAIEKITVPAGTFECMRVQGMMVAATDAALAVAKMGRVKTTKLTYWYCPEVQWSAHWITEQQQFLGSPWTRSESVLLSYVRRP